jgi:hypothetical protein
MENRGRAANLCSVADLDDRRTDSIFGIRLATHLANRSDQFMAVGEKQGYSKQQHAKSKGN